MLTVVNPHFPDATPVSGFKNVSTFTFVNFSQSFILSSKISNCSKQYNLIKDSFAIFIANSFSPFNQSSSALSDNASKYLICSFCSLAFLEQY